MRETPVARFVRELDGDFYLLSEVAAACGIPASTLRRLRAKDPKVWGPAFTQPFGGITIYLYTGPDLQRVAREVLKLRRQNPAATMGAPGRPRLWSEGEVVDRQRRMMKARYYERRGRALRGEGAKRESAQMLTRARILRRQLNSEAKVRRGQVATRM